LVGSQRLERTERAGGKTLKNGKDISRQAQGRREKTKTYAETIPMNRDASGPAVSPAGETWNETFEKRSFLL